MLLASALVASFFFPQFFGKGTDKLERQILGVRFQDHARVNSVIQTIRSLPEPQMDMCPAQSTKPGTPYWLWSGFHRSATAMSGAKPESILASPNGKAPSTGILENTTPAKACAWKKWTS